MLIQYYSMQGSADLLRIEKQSDENYHIGKQKIMVALTLCDIDHFVEDVGAHEGFPKCKIDVDCYQKRLRASHSASNLVSGQKLSIVTMANGEKMVSYVNRVKQLACSLQ